MLLFPLCHIKGSANHSRRGQILSRVAEHSPTTCDCSICDCVLFLQDIWSVSTRDSVFRLYVLLKQRDRKERWWLYSLTSNICYTWDGIPTYTCKRYSKSCNQPAITLRFPETLVFKDVIICRTLYSNSMGIYGPASIYAFAIIGATLNKFLMGPVVRAVVKQEEREGHFRYSTYE